MKAVFILFAITVLLWFSKLPAHAVSVSVTNFPSSITDQPFTLTASISGAGTGTNYLKAVLFKDNTANYFGETYNGNSWYNGGDCTLYFPLTIDNSKAVTGTFQARVGTPNNIDYPGSGAYKLKIVRYTNSCSVNQNDTQTFVDINISYTAPTPTSTPTVTPAPTPTSLPTPSPTLTPSAMPTINQNPTQQVTTQATTATGPQNQQQVLGDNSNSLFSIPTQSPDGNKGMQLFSSSDKQIISKILIVLGIIFMFLCGIVIFYPKIDEFIKAKKNE